MAVSINGTTGIVTPAIESTSISADNLTTTLDALTFEKNIVLSPDKQVKKVIPLWHPVSSSTGGTVTTPLNELPRTLDAWEIIANINMSQGNPGLQYRHVKFDYASTAGMMYFWLNGYGYNRGNTDTKIGLYMYTGTTILNVYINNNGNASVFHSAYKAADGKLVLCIDTGSTSYTSANAQLYVKGHDDQYNYNNIKIEAITSTSSTGAQF